MKKPTKSFLLLFIIILLGAGLLAACSQSAPNTQTDALAELSSPTQTQSGDLPTATVEGYPAPESQALAATYTPFPYPEPGAGDPPPVKEGLEASDPATVQLASGKPQLVEFFAFW
ncbi:MAG TPA: hypothetical protein VI755_01210 [Anaerolineales bacterium]|nr:hypothetical protein [Anaerolineales bacterium]